jgi:hypothetical protein
MMTVRVLAFHYPASEHRAEMVERIKRAVEVMRGSPGFIDADCWIGDGGEAVVATGTFESKERWLQAMRTVAGADIDFDYDERELKPRSVQLLLEA